MFGSTALEIAIGLILMYLGLSVVCSALNEYISTALDRRGTHLRYALFAMLDDDDPKGRSFLSRFFSHPLILVLSPASREGKAAGLALRVAEAASHPVELGALLKSLRNTPQYIPDRTFADVVLDLLNRPDPAGAAPTAPPAESAEALASEVRRAVARFSSALPGEVKGTLDATAGALLRDVAAAATPRAAWEAVAAALGSIRSASAAIDDGPARAAVIAALDGWGPRRMAHAPDRAAAEATLRAAQEALGAIRGALGSVPDGPTRVRIAAGLDELSAGLVALGSAAAPAAVVAEAAGAALATLRGLSEMLGPEGGRDALLALIGREALRLAATGEAVMTIHRLRAAVEELPDCEFRTALRALMDEESQTLDDVNRNIRRWYNDAMDRLSGWYKRNTQVILAVIALVVAVALNADTIQVGNRLLQDPVLRAVAAESARAVVDGDRPAADGRRARSPTGGQGADAVMALDRLRLPLFWDAAQFDRLASLVGRGRGAKLADGLEKLVGLLLTALALSMGAPFWYEVLIKVANVRGTGTRPEKTA